QGALGRGDHAGQPQAVALEAAAAETAGDPAVVGDPVRLHHPIIDPDGVFRLRGGLGAHQLDLRALRFDRGQKALAQSRLLRVDLGAGDQAAGKGQRRQAHARTGSDGRGPRPPSPLREPGSSPRYQPYRHGRGPSTGASPRPQRWRTGAARASSPAVTPRGAATLRWQIRGTTGNTRLSDEAGLVLPIRTPAKNTRRTAGGSFLRRHSCAVARRDPQPRRTVFEECTISRRTKS